MPAAKISALGCYVPPGLLTNQDLEKMVDTNDQWILERTGISQRHILGEGHSDIRHGCSKPPRSPWPSAAIEASELDAIIVCTVTPDMFFSRHGVSGSESPGSERRVGIRPGRGLLRFHLRPHHHRRAPGNVGIA